MRTQTKAASERRILNVFRTSKYEWLSTMEVSNCLAISRQHTWRRLNELYEDGAIDRRESDGRSFLWRRI
jgi:biotin operon repressor